MSSICIATYNIKLGGELAGYDMKVLADVIKNSGAEVIALQEVDQNTKRNKMQDTVKLLSEYTGYQYYAFAPALEQNPGQYGNALLSKFPINSWEVVLLPNHKSYTDEQRVALCATLDINGSVLTVLSTHCNGGPHFAGQMAALASTASKKALPFVVMGDFNSDDGNIICNAFPGCAVINNAPKKMVTTIDNYCFDNMILSHEIQYRNIKIVDTGKSDHYLLLAEITF